MDVPAAFLTSVGSPEWLLVMAGGIGAGCQTVATFVPVVFFMFLALAILENLGYAPPVSRKHELVISNMGSIFPRNHELEIWMLCAACS